MIRCFGRDAWTRLMERDEGERRGRGKGSEKVSSTRLKKQTKEEDRPFVMVPTRPPWT